MGIISEWGLLTPWHKDEVVDDGGPPVGGPEVNATSGAYAPYGYQPKGIRMMADTVGNHCAVFLLYFAFFLAVSVGGDLPRALTDWMMGWMSAAGG